MNLKKLSSFLLGVLMLFSAMPAQAAGDSDDNSSNSRTSKISVKERADRYKNLLDEIYGNKDNIEILNRIFREMKQEIEVTDRKIRDFKSSRKKRLSKDDKNALDEMLIEQACRDCVYHMSDMYLALASIEQHSMPFEREEVLRKSVSTSIGYVRNMRSKNDFVNIHLGYRCNKMICEVKYRLKLSNYKFSIRSALNSSTLLEDRIRMLTGGNTALEDSVYGLSKIKESLEERRSQLKTLVSMLGGKNG